MVNQELYKRAKDFVIASLNILEKNAKQGIVVSKRKITIRIFEENGGMQLAEKDSPLYESNAFVDAFGGEVYNSDAAKALADFLLESKSVSGSTKDEKELESQNWSIRHNHLRSFLTGYIDRVGSLKLDDGEFDKSYKEFEEYFSSTKSSYVAIAPLNNFESESSEIDFGNGLKIRQITENEFDLLHRIATNNHSSFGGFSFPEILGVKYVLELQYEANKNSYGGEYGRPFEMLISALRIYKSGQVRYNTTVVRAGGWQPYGGIVTTSNTEKKMLFGDLYKVDAQETTELKEFWNIFKQFDFNRNKFLDIAIMRLNYAYERPKLEDKLIDFFISLEAMFLTGSEKSELRYRLAIRMAKFLGTTPENKNQIFGDIKKAYRLRSEVVHGVSVINQQEVSGLTPKIENYTRRSIRDFIDELKTKSYETIMSNLDTTIFT